MCAPATNTCETTTAPDAQTPDGAVDAAIDAPIDAPMPVIVARYLFDDDLVDTAGEHDAAAVGTELTYLEGRNGAQDHALRIPTTLSSYVRIPDAPAFDIPSGSIELWFQYDGTAPVGELGLVSRDANGTNTNGHVNLRLLPDRRVVLRIQRTSTPTIEAYRCTAAALAANAWHRVVVTFGATLTMEVDGVVASGISWTDGDGDELPCTAAWNTGIDGNDNPWVVGALTVVSNEGTGLPVIAIAGGVQFDELVIRSIP